MVVGLAQYIHQSDSIERKGEKRERNYCLQGNNDVLGEKATHVHVFNMYSKICILSAWLYHFVGCLLLGIPYWSIYCVICSFIVTPMCIPHLLLSRAI